MKNAILDLVVYAEKLFTFTSKSKKALVLEHAVVSVHNGKIVKIEKRNGALPKARQYIDGSHKLMMPGLINGHTHLAMTLFRGLAEDLPFEEWLHDYILPIEAKLLDKDFVRVGTELALWECMRFGTTTVADMYYFTDTVAECVDRVGLRGILAETTMDFPQPDDKAGAGTNYKILDANIKKYKNHERITPAIGPHAPYSCSDKNLKTALNYAKKNKIPLLIHVSETEKEVKDSIKQYKKTPVERLNKIGITTHPSVFAHCVHLTSKDLKILSKSKSSVVHNPESNMKLKCGVAPIRKIIDSDINLGLGTDGCASNNNLNLFEEMDTALKLQKLMSENILDVKAEDILYMATLGGAKALGFDKKIGSLEVGKQADFIMLNLNAPQMIPLHDIVSQLVLSATGAEVETVVCDGIIIFENKRPVHLNIEKLVKEVNEYQSKISKFLSQKSRNQKVGQGKKTHSNSKKKRKH